MKSVQVIKKVNNTELGKAATHETYVLVPQELNVSDLFEELEKKYKFVDKVTNKTYELRLTSGREKRIVGLGPFYRDHDVFAGDEPASKIKDVWTKYKNDDNAVLIITHSTKLIKDLDVD